MGQPVSSRAEHVCTKPQAISIRLVETTVPVLDNRCTQTRTRSGCDSPSSIRQMVRTLPLLLAFFRCPVAIAAAAGRWVTWPS